MPSNIHVFTGENVFALEEALGVWTKQFALKHGTENLLRIDAKDVTARDLLDIAGVAPFLAAKRLAVLRGQPKLTKEDVAVLAASMHPDVVLLFAEPKYDQRLGGIKELLKLAHVETFAPLRRPQLLAWMAQFARQQGAVLSPDAAQQLLQVVGDDQQMIASELCKLSLFAGGATISTSDVDILAMPGEGSQWRLTDLLTEGRTHEALLYADDLSKRGQDAFATWNILLWLIRTLVLVAGCASSGMTQAASVARAAGVPPYRVQPLLALQRRIGMPAIRTLVRQAVASDVALKTGGYRASADDPEELESLIDRLILRFG
jgi:DNA polymerase-3 subunit delta